MVRVQTMPRRRPACWGETFMRAMTSWILILAALWPVATDAAEVVEPGHTAVWRDPARPGEGLMLEILGPQSASLTWFTYDGAGAQRWAYGLGTIVRDDVGARVVFPQLLMTSGGRFGVDYDAAQVTIDVVGSATLRFADCDRGVFEVEAFGTSMSLPLERLTRTMAAGCAPIHGVIGEPVKSYAAQTGVWSNPARRGQGLQLQWMSRDEAGLAWYTFDTEGNRYWLSGVGKFEDGRIVFPQMIATRGARFGAAFDPPDVELIDWGRVEMEIDCDSGVVRHASKLEAFGSGEQPVFLLTRPIDGACPWVRPKLSDLYDVSIELLPSSDQVIALRSVSDAGVVTGVERSAAGRVLVQRAPGDADWTVISPQLLPDDDIFVAPDAASVLFTEQQGAFGSATLSRTPVLFESEVGVTPLAGIAFDASFIHGASVDLSRVVGRGMINGDPRTFPWVWDAASGQRPLTVSGEISQAMPVAVGNDGIVVGQGGSPSIPNTGFFNVPYYFAMRWGRDGRSEVLRDKEGRVLAAAGACGERCDTILGNGTLDTSIAVPNQPGAWYWKSPSDNAFLRSFDADLPWSRYNYAIAHVSADGSFAVGSLLFDRPGGGQDYDALLWTQNTGAVGVKALLGELDLPLAWNKAYAVAIAANGKFVLLSDGYGPGRGAVLRLDPRQNPAAP
jgi:hypothetical protein